MLPIVVLIICAAGLVLAAASLAMARSPPAAHAAAALGAAAIGGVCTTLFIIWLSAGERQIKGCAKFCYSLCAMMPPLRWPI